MVLRCRSISKSTSSNGKSIQVSRRKAAGHFSRRGAKPLAAYLSVQITKHLRPTSAQASQPVPMSVLQHLGLRYINATKRKTLNALPIKRSFNNILTIKYS